MWVSRLKWATMALAFVMVVGMLPTTAFATVEGDQTLPTEAEIAQAIRDGLINSVDDQNQAVSLYSTGIRKADVRERIVSFSGSNRLETAAMEALHGRESSEWVVVVGSDGWPDALSASGLAGALSAPILLTDAGALSDEAAGAISELGAARAVVVGGESAVSASAVAGLEAAGLEVDRVAGADRYETQRSVFAYGRERGLWGSSYVLAASGENFADALSLAPVAYAEKAPVFLVGADGDFSAAQYGDLRLCASAPAGTALAAGGEAVMSERALGALRVVAGEVVRLAGENRYETSAEVAAWAVSRGVLSWDGVALASGESPYDALAGSAVQGSGRSVLLLASDTSGAASVLAAHRQSISQVKFFGGKAAVSMTVRMEICDALDFNYDNLAGLKVYVDAGHGWGDNGNSSVFDPGAIGSGYREADLTAELAHKVADCLRSYGVEVYVNDDGGYYRYRHAEAVALGCDILVSLHFNSGGGHGTESYIHSANASPRSSLLQNVVHPRLVAGTGLFDRGRHSEDFGLFGGFCGRDSGIGPAQRAKTTIWN